MGLAAPKRRNKLSHDPNNTSWFKSANTYGQKILSAQGWKPGDYLGAENANHSGHYTAANASHIKVLLREENLGLGAHIGQANAQTFGLSLFSGVLGRLNGKSDAELEKQQGALRDAELRNYQAKRHGLMNFVSGGVLVGDKIKPAEKEGGSFTTARPHKAEDLDSIKIPKKRKLEDDNAGSKSSKKLKASDERFQVKEVIKEGKKRKRREREPLPQNAAAGGYKIADDSQSTEMEGQNARTGENVRIGPAEMQSDNAHREQARPPNEEQQLPPESHGPERNHAKLEKRARKEERRKRKEERRRSKSTKEALTTKFASDEELHAESTKTAVMQGNRHAVRQRYIQQKRMSSLNAQAVKEIFMLKASA